MVNLSEINEQSRKSKSNHCIFLLIALAAMMLIFPIIDGTVPLKTQILIGIFDSAILISSVVVVSHQRRRVFVFAITLGGASTILSWLDAFLDKNYSGATSVADLVHLVSLAMSIAFFAFMTSCVLGYVLRGEVVTKDRLAGAVCVYLLLGILWALAYEIIWEVDPGAFKSPSSSAELTNPESIDNGEPVLEDASAPGRTSELLYFSFVTITTLGYGDITPVSRLARSVAALEALTGSFYMVLLVARLVGLYRPKRTDQSD